MTFPEEWQHAAVYYQEKLTIAMDELDRLQAEVHEANAACDSQVRECNRLRAENAELLTFVRNVADTQEFSGRSMMLFMKAAKALLAMTPPDPPKETE